MIGWDKESLVDYRCLFIYQSQRKCEGAHVFIGMKLNNMYVFVPLVCIFYFHCDEILGLCQFGKLLARPLLAENNCHSLVNFDNISGTMYQTFPQFMLMFCA